MKDDDAKRIILERRARFVAAAIAGLGITAVSGQACGGKEETGSTDTQGQAGSVQTGGTGGYAGQPQPCLEPQVCLSMSAAGNDQPYDAGPQVCLGAGGAGGEPQVCLSMIYIPPEAGSDAVDEGREQEAGDSGPDVATPLPCLVPPV